MLTALSLRSGALRARTDKDGKEIGLRPMIPVSVSGEQVGDGLTSEVFSTADVSGMLRSPGPPPSEVHKTFVLAVQVKEIGWKSIWLCESPFASLVVIELIALSCMTTTIIIFS